jgi:hypothetical protein
VLYAFEEHLANSEAGLNFFIWIRCNPLKSHVSTKEMQGNASLFIWIYLLFLGFIWIDICAKRNALKLAAGALMLP